MKRPVLALLPLSLTFAATACHSAPAAALRDVHYPGKLQHPATLPVEAVWQQYVTASWSGPDGQQERGFDAAVQRQGDSLTVVGLSPLGSVGFSITQRPDGIDVVNQLPEQMVIPPSFILLDVQRALFPWFAQAGAEGPRSVERDGEIVAERWHQGRLTERTFIRAAGEPEGVIRVRYEWGQNDWAAPTRAVLDNGWFGYRLTIATISETRIPPGDRP